MYNNMSDEDILAHIRVGEDNDAIEYLIKKYMPLVKKESRKLYIIGAENEDLIQEGMIGLIKAIRDYNDNKGASFSTFAVLCIRRQMVTAVNTSNRKKHLPLNYYVSLYASDGESDAELVDELVAGDSSEPEEILIGRAKKESVYDMIETRLSKYEKQVLSEYLTGDSYEVISERMNKPVKSIDNAIQRIRKKLK
ncbi:MAG: sigma-70 family RNA polymerase sigma factor [Coprococcus sp.]